MRIALLIVVLPLLGIGLLWGDGTETAYEVLDENAQPLKTRFNGDRGKVRILVYVAPTCGGCLRQADQIQKNVLAEIDDPGLAIYVVWAPRNGAREEHVERVLRLVRDPRATQYWDEPGAVADPVDAMLGLTGPCAGIAMLYGPEARWEASGPPAPAYWEDAHDFEFQRAAEQFDAQRFAGRVGALLGRAAKEAGR